MKRTAVALSMFLLAFSLSACNTVNGFGKDLQKLGKQIDEKSSK
ncbi:entericidin [Chitinibacter sp. SCUT-21]